MASLELRFLGGFDAVQDGETIRSFDTDKTRALLAYLAVETTRPHRRDYVACLFWPNRPDRVARTSLRQAIYRLRLALDDHDRTLLLITRQDIRFNTAGDYCLDVDQFTDLLARCRSHAASHWEPCSYCTQWMQQAVALYLGDFLTGLSVSGSVAFENWLLARQECYHRLALDALQRLTIYHEVRQDYHRAETYARRQIELEPWHEDAHRAVMRILALAGQRNAALDQYQICCNILAVELGIEPSHRTTSLYRAIRNEDADGRNSGEWTFGSALHSPITTSS